MSVPSCHALAAYLIMGRRRACENRHTKRACMSNNHCVVMRMEAEVAKLCLVCYDFYKILDVLFLHARNFAVSYFLHVISYFYHICTYILSFPVSPCFSLYLSVFPCFRLSFLESLLCTLITILQTKLSDYDSVVCCKCVYILHIARFETTNQRRWKKGLRYDFLIINSMSFLLVKSIADDHIHLKF